MNRRQFVIAGSLGLAGIGFAQTNSVPPGLRPGDQRNLPAFSLRDMAGNVVRSSDLLGNVVILRFWATW